MTKLNEAEVAILRAFYERKEQNPRFPRVSGDDLKLVEHLHKSQSEIEFEIDYLTDEGYFMNVLNAFGSSYDLSREISSKGITYLHELDYPTDERDSSSQIIYNSGTIINSVVGNGNTASINISESFNALRDIVKSDDEANQIISEMENEAKDENPSLDAILKKGKKLWKKYGEAVTEEVIKIVGALIRSIMS